MIKCPGGGHKAGYHITARKLSLVLRNMQACRHTEKERSAAAEESKLQADIEQLRTEAAAATRLLQSLEDRANAGDDAVVEVKSLRTEVAATTAARTEAERRLKESECKLQCARDEMEMMQDKVRRTNH